MNHGGSKESDEKDLVARCVGGSREAWRAFVERHAATAAGKASEIYRRGFARDALGQEVQEVVQETFLQLFRNDARSLRNFQWRCSLSTYVAAVAARTALKRLRSQRRAQPPAALPADVSKLDALLPADAPAPLERVLSEEARGELLKLIGTLPAKDRLVLQMSFWEGFSSTRIAEGLGTSPDYVRVLLRRALEKIRKKIP